MPSKRFVITEHAKARMLERNILNKDVYFTVALYPPIKAQGNCVKHVSQELTVVLENRTDAAVVITAYYNRGS